MCGFSKSIYTCPESPQSVDVNTSAVTAVMNVGGGYTQLVNITGAMNIPSLSFSLYKKIHSEICTAWEDLAWKSMKEAAEEEKMIALQCGSVDVNGTPMITVVGDGSWAKRSYRGTGNYNSLSGTAAIVGLKSKKILYLGVKNKYCCVCQRAKNIGTEAAAHTCYKNWNLSSTAMEANIIAEGFCASLEMYGLIYNKLIADGDSSCYKKLLDSRPYETCTVEKIECSNHLLRNYCNKLKELSKMRGIPGSLKNILSNNILRCRTAVVKAIKYRRSEANTSLEDNIKNLRKDIINSVSHIFGEHLNCSELRYFCEKTEPDQNNYMSDFRTLNLDEKLMDAVRYLAGHSRSLLENVTTNVVEQFNSIIAQKLGGKRVNYTQRRCYQGRCYSAVVSKNCKQPLYNVHKHLTGGYSPGKTVQEMELRKLRRQNVHKQSRARKKLIFSSASTDADYGDNCQKPDVDQETFEEMKSEFIRALHKSTAEYEEIEKKTRLQADSSEWKHYRRKLLTSSIFGKICKMRKSTSCSSTFAKTESVVTVQRAFRIKFGCAPPGDNNIRRWYHQFQDTGCLCKGKSTGRPRTSEESVEQVRNSLTRSPMKSVRKASRELAIPVTTVWRVLRRRLELRPYRLQLLQALKPTDHLLRANFANDMLLHDNEDFLDLVVFSDESTFHLSGRVNTHNVRIWGSENPHMMVQVQRDSPKLNVFCAISGRKFMVLSFLVKQLSLQDGAPPHWHNEVRDWLNLTVPYRWIGRKGPNDRACFAWPPRSPDLTPCDFYLWGFIKDRVYVPPLPADLPDLRNRIETAVAAITNETLIKVWEELAYRLDVCQVTNGAHIEHL
ncbi:uncharacterized protein LOC116161496 [Photinus pyralis]|nr:uncharacterized protein LOC116161496 [Photinus pyralis]